MQDASELGEQKDMCLSFSEVSELTGTTPSNLRFFEEEGILDIPRNGAGCRVFHRKEMEELPELVCFKHSGLKLKEIKRFFTWFAKVIRHCANVTACCRKGIRP